LKDGRLTVYNPVTTTTVVQFSQIDLMHHLNNASAVELLDNAGWEAMAGSEITPAGARLVIRHYDIEYGDSPRFDDRLEVQSWLNRCLKKVGSLPDSSASRARARP
jgi:acyl-CoA thioesterase FadM